jgi:hypothetical protein
MRVRRDQVLTVLTAILALPTVAAAQSPEKRAPTFAKDVAPIFQQKCQDCHRPGARGVARPVRRAVRRHSNRSGYDGLLTAFGDVSITVTR